MSDTDAPKVTDAFEWGDPPERPGHSGGIPRYYEAVVRRLAERPGVWALIRRAPSQGSAASMASNGNTGKWAGVERGAVEATYGPIADSSEWGVWARVPEPKEE